MGRAAEPESIGGGGLAIRSLVLTGLRWSYPLVSGLGVALLVPLGGFVPVLDRHRRGGLRGWSELVEALGGAWPGVERADPDSDLGPSLTRAEAPGLFDLTAEVARRLGAKPPERIRLTWVPCCGVAARRHSRALLVGLPLLQILSLAELRAVLAHELAHLARGDATVSAASSRFIEALGRAIDQAPIRPWGPLGAWARFCRSVGDRLRGPIARGQEVRADRLAAALAGGAATADALVKVALVQPLFREVLEHYDPDQIDSPNLYAFFRDFWRRLPDSLRSALRQRLLTDQRGSIDPVHPALRDRLACVQSAPDRPFPGGDRPALTLLGDPEALERRLHDRLFATDRVEPSLFHRAGS